MRSAAGILLARRDGTSFTTQYGEAFSLMKYQNAATGRIEWLWNSRDGVTPFGINDPTARPEEIASWRAASKTAAQSIDYGAWLRFNPNPAAMNHADWGEDSFLPNFVPPLGMRIFMSWSDATQVMRARAKLSWEARLASAAYADMPDDYRAKAMAGEPFGYEPDSPMVEVVDEELFAIFQVLARDNPFVRAPARPRFA